MKSEWNWRFFRGVLGETVAHWFERGAVSQSASLAFFTLVSLAPLLVLVVSVAGSAFGKVAVRHELVGQFQQLMGKDQAAAVEKILKTASESDGRGLAGIVGIGTLIFGATAVFAQLQSSLNRMWDVEPKRGEGILGVLKKRLLSLALVIGLGFLLLVSLAFSAAINASQEFFRARLPLPAIALDIAVTVFSFLIFTLLFAMIFRILPDIEIPWRDVWVGALATSFLFSVGKWAIGLYLGRTALGSAYGAAASAIVLLFWVYYASMLVLFGAAFTRVRSRHRRRLQSAGGKHAPGVGRPKG